MMSASKEFEISSPPPDGISSLSFSPTSDYLAASCWDGSTRVWETQYNGMSVLKDSLVHEGPSLCCCWNKDGTKLFSVGADKQIRILDLMTGSKTGLIGHEAPIKSCRWMDSNSSALVTAGWDKNLKYWDLRTPNPIATVNLPERCYSMDISSSLLVAATAERHVVIINLSSPTQIFKQVLSPLKYQTRCVSCFVDAKGYAIGSIEGRVGIQYIEDKLQSKYFAFTSRSYFSNFAFKCHRVDANIFSVNSISFHPVYGTFATAGSDGTYSFWDKDSKTRLKAHTAPNPPIPIPASCFNRTGNMFAYASCYDWSKGHEFNYPNSKNTITLSLVEDNDVKPKKKR